MVYAPLAAADEREPSPETGIHGMIAFDGLR